MSTFAAIVSTLGAVVVAVVTGVCTWLVARQSSKATARATEVTAENNMVTQALTMAAEYREDRDDQRSRLDALEKRAGENEAALRAERLKREALSRELDRERERLTALEARFKAAVAYINALIVLLKSHDIQVPPPPDGINLAD